MALIVPAVLPATKAELERWLAHFARFPSVTRIQIDVVDGRIATPASWPYSAKATQGTPYNVGFPKSYIEVRALTLSKQGAVEYEIDLMCVDAFEAVGEWLRVGATRFTFHVSHPLAKRDALLKVRSAHGGLGTSSLLALGVAIHVDTNLSAIAALLEQADYLQVMGIAKIGRQGERFDERALAQVDAIHALYPDMPIQVDGGITLDSGRRCLAHGASTLVVGSAIVGAKEPMQAFAEFEALEGPYGV